MEDEGWRVFLKILSCCDSIYIMADENLKWGEGDEKVRREEREAPRERDENEVGFPY